MPPTPDLEWRAVEYRKFVVLEDPAPLTDARTACLMITHDRGLAADARWILHDWRGRPYNRARVTYHPGLAEAKQSAADRSADPDPFTITPEQAGRLMNLGEEARQNHNTNHHGDLSACVSTACRFAAVLVLA